MSTLNSKITQHLEQHFPTEYDEKWVSQLLTDQEKTEPAAKIRPKAQCQSKALLNDIEKVERELGLKRRVKRTPPRKEFKQASQTNKSSNSSAIEKQIIAFSVKKKMQTSTIRGKDEKPSSFPRLHLLRRSRP